MLTVNKLIAQGRGLAPVLLKRASQVALDWDVRCKSRFDATDSASRTLGVFLARGTVVDPAALLSTLQERRIAGAALDVFPDEPLPANSPLWRLNNVIITPHVGGVSAHYNERAIALFADNLKRYLSGTPLLNRFEPEKGY